eukprot:288555-Amphidinium_carterae.1
MAALALYLCVSLRFVLACCTFTPLDRDALRTAVKAWIADPIAAENQYGAIGTWDTSNIEDMNRLFDGASTFNADISNWDTSQVVDMAFMFFGATTFHADISNWDTSRVVNMGAMFYNADTFNADISNWDTSQVVDMAFMFY